MAVASSSAQASSSGPKSWIEMRSRPVTLRCVKKLGLAPGGIVVAITSYLLLASPDGKENQNVRDSIALCQGTTLVVPIRLSVFFRADFSPRGQVALRHDR